MAVMVNDCPRCGTQKITFDIKGANYYGRRNIPNYKQADFYEIYAVCKECNRSTIFISQQLENVARISQITWNDNPWNINEVAKITGVVTPADLNASTPPEYLPDDINSIYLEGAKCLSVDCYNAAATMFRLCLDYATKDLLPDETKEPNNKIRRSLGLRMAWLFDNGILPVSLKDLAECVKDDGNDGAHEGILDKEAALNLEDFTYILLERLYTEKERLVQAKKRREQRKSK